MKKLCPTYSCHSATSGIVALTFNGATLTVSWRGSLSYRNQFIGEKHDSKQSKLGFNWDTTMTRDAKSD